ncbi:MAG: hypothetical protein NDJ94_07425 [Vicinamibacteria bacterium]|nr:hypothetical protein [Vicinamibacteria bacterium]
MPERERSRKACCMVSELLEESGVDREKLRLARRQILEGVILMCRWQLERMEEATAAEPAPKKPRRGRRIVVE